MTSFPNNLVSQAIAGFYFSLISLIPFALIYLDNQIPKSVKPFSSEVTAIWNRTASLFLLPDQLFAKTQVRSIFFLCMWRHILL